MSFRYTTLSFLIFFYKNKDHRTETTLQTFIHGLFISVSKPKIKYDKEKIYLLVCKIRLVSFALKNIFSHKHCR